jgi:glutamine amidotransferase
MRVSVVDYGSGNLASAARALAAAAARADIDATVAITDRPEDIVASDRIVVPGQGAFADCAAGLSAIPGLRHAIDGFVQSGRPFLGICVGMQLMAERGLEHQVTPGFGWIEGDIAKLSAPGLRLPHMGWNALDFAPGSHQLLAGLSPGDEVYFVHSYGLRGYDARQVIAFTDYGGAVPAVVAHDNCAGTQFHVEKSQETGLQILANFLRWSPGTAA